VRAASSRILAAMPRRCAPNQNIENNPMQSSRRSPATTLWAST
jgi:hypothetical protein